MVVEINIRREKKEKKKNDDLFDYKQALLMVKHISDLELLVSIICSNPKGCFRSGQSRDMYTRLYEKMIYCKFYYPPGTNFIKSNKFRKYAYKLSEYFQRVPTSHPRRLFILCKLAQKFLF